jgi:hypothetical protein
MLFAVIYGKGLRVYLTQQLCDGGYAAFVVDLVVSE